MKQVLLNVFAHMAVMAVPVVAFMMGNSMQQDKITDLSETIHIQNKAIDDYKKAIESVVTLSNTTRDAIEIVCGTKRGK